MSEDKTTQQTDNTPTIVSGGSPPEMKISNEDRALLAEVWHEMLATKNGLTALEVMKLKLDAEKRVIELQAEQHVRQGLELQTEMDKRLQEVRAKYNLPDGYNINTKTGLVTPPDQPVPQNGAPLVQVQPAGDPQVGDTARSAPAPATPQPGLVEAPR